MLDRLAEQIKKNPGPAESKLMLTDLCEKIEQPSAGYWAHRMTPGGTVLESVPALIGKSMAMTIIINIFFPLLICRARAADDSLLRDAILQAYANAPSLEAHHITRLMRYRIWGDINGGASLLRREIVQQGLLQVFFDFCDGHVRNCANCPMPELIAAGPELPLEMDT